jgi:hypothetical protein
VATFRRRASVGRVDVNVGPFEAAVGTALVDMVKTGEALLTTVGDAVTREVKGKWPVSDDDDHTRDGIVGQAKRTGKGRYFYEVRVPYPGGFYELGTRRQPPRPIVRPTMAAARRYLRG